MSIEVLLWGFLPTVVALCAGMVSLFVAFRARRVFHFIASAVVIATVAWSLLSLYWIFALGAWPTYLPHGAIGVVVVIVVAQTFLFGSKRHDVV